MNGSADLIIKAPAAQLSLIGGRDRLIHTVDGGLRNVSMELRERDDLKSYGAKLQADLVQKAMEDAPKVKL